VYKRTIMHYNNHMNNNEIPTIQFVWEEYGMDYQYEMQDEDGNVLETLAVIKNEQGSNAYDLYVDDVWLADSVWSNGCKKFAEEFFAWLTEIA
jgi:hypothetical protein